MPDKKKRLGLFLDDLQHLIGLSKTVLSHLQSRYPVFKTAIEKGIPSNLVLNFFFYFYIRRQLRHARSIVLLHKQNNKDTLLIVRSMLEGVSQVRYLYHSKDKNETAKQWAEFPYGTGGYWFNNQPANLMSKLEKHVSDVIKGGMPKQRMLEYYGYFSAYHHWNVKGPLPKHREDEAALAFAFFCLRYFVRIANDVLKLGFEEKLRDQYPSGMY